MDAFKISRSAALASVTPLMRSIVYLTIIAAWKHESGAWLCIATTPGHPAHYSVHWRSTEHWGAGSLEFVDAFENPLPVKAWAHALESAEKAWTDGPSVTIRDKAEKTRDMLTDKLSSAGTRGGQKSGQVRAAMSEERKDAEALGKKYALHFIPQFDTRIWFFNPSWDARDRPVINFTWKKQQQTYAYLAISKDGATWELGRGWFPGMNDDNARIEEICFKELEGVSLSKDCPAVQILERLLKTDPEKWLRNDYTRFS